MVWCRQGKRFRGLTRRRRASVRARERRRWSAKTPAAGNWPCVFPDGKRGVFIASLGRADGKAAVFVAKVGGGTGSLKRITPWQKLGDKVDCAPDGTRVAFSTDFGPPKSGNVFTVGIDGTGLRQVTR